MSTFAYKELLEILDKEEVKELHIAEGMPPVIGMYKKLESPIIQNGKQIDGGIQNHMKKDYGIISSGDCIQLLEELQKTIDQRIIPDEDGRLIIYNDDRFRLIVNNMQEGQGLNIAFRKPNVIR